VTFEDRRLLGHHVDRNAASPLCYSRDECTRLAALVYGVLHLIRTGVLDPDLPRVMRLKALVEQGETLDRHTVVDHDEPVSEVGSEDCASEDLEDELDDLSSNLPGLPPPSAQDEEVVKHVLSGVLHFKVSGDRLKDKAKAYGLPEATTALLVNNGVNTLGKLAFVSAYQPGMADEAPLFTALEEVMGRGPTAAEKPILRRLYFEANTVCLADMRARIERTDASEPRKLPMAERSSRAELQKTRLEGVVMTLDNEPSHALVDRIFQQQDDGCISWIPWGQLTSRSQEAVQIKKVISFALDASGGLKARAQEDHLEARLVGDARLRQALQRRALAYDLSRMIDYKTLETWTETLFAEMMRDPPKGYRTVTVQQVQEADKRLWQLVSEQTRGNVSMQADNSKPVDAAIKLYMERTEVRLLLQPLPAASGCSAFTDANKPCCRNFNTKGCDGGTAFS
ncbi:gpt, partial [Symbiodinium necroappetens]